MAGDKRKSRVTTVLINVAACLEKTDEQVLPALYSRVGASFGATPTQLGNITLARAFMQALASPLAGVAAHFMPRGHVIAIGCLLWSTFTALFAFTNSVAWALPLCAINGIGLALVIPSVQSLTADLTRAEARGRAFGALWLTISFGGMLGALYATNTGAHRPFGLDGWRVAFWSVAVVSAITGLLNAKFVHDPTFQHQSSTSSSSTLRKNQADSRAFMTSSGGGGAGGSAASSNNNSSMNLAGGSSKHHHHHHNNNNNNSNNAHSGGLPLPGEEASLLGGPTSKKLDVALAKTMAADIYSVLKIPTFALIIAQGIVGSIPYASLVFLTLYLQLLGMSDASASALVALYLVGGGLGGLLGGAVGDAAATRWPNHGRVAVTQFSVASGIPFAVFIFKGLPLDGHPSTVALYAMALLSFALLTAWPAPACNNPVFAEITPVKLRNLVYAFDRCFEGAMAAFATPFVGLLSERYFGFSGASTVSGVASTDTANARALGNALLTFMVVPWTLCLIAYSSLHWTYPIDRRRALSLNRTRSLQEGDEDLEEAVEFLSAKGFTNSSSSGGVGGGGGLSTVADDERVFSGMELAREQQLCSQANSTSSNGGSVLRRQGSVSPDVNGRSGGNRLV